MKITVANLRYVEPSNTLIDVEVTLVDGYGEYAPGTVIPFTYNPSDRAPIADAVGELLEAGGVIIAPFVAE